MSQNQQDVYLETIEIALEAQLKAIRKLRNKQVEPEHKPAKRRSQLSIVCDILKKNGRPMHISDIILHAEQHFHARLNRESIVSSLTKKVLREDTFARTDKNTFTLIEFLGHVTD